MALRALRGATRVEVDERDAVIEATAELLRAVLERNAVSTDDLISIVFTTTPDLVSEFPAVAARTIGLTDVPLLCASEIAVPHSMPRVVRLMAFVEADFARADAQHVYLRGASALRADLFGS
ncbi:MAG TPA: chorismate mutase [Mycobacteriales bacterium]|nr:chorismate mutase [Mycobacteriales bacterium]